MTRIKIRNICGTHDKNINVFVRKVSNEPCTWGMTEGLEETYILPIFLNNSYSKIDFNDPSNMIANIGVLPEGTKIDWQTKPIFDDNGYLMEDNTPVIRIKEPGKSQSILLPLNDIDKSWINAARYDHIPIWKNYPVQLSGDANNVSPIQFLGNLDEVARYNFQNGESKGLKFDKFLSYLSNPHRWQWTLPPNLQNAGYTVAFAQFIPLDSDFKDKTLSPYAEYVNEYRNSSTWGVEVSFRIHVLPNHVSTDKDVTRTIVVTDPISGKKTITYQTVHFTANGEQKIYDGPIENIQWDSGTNNGQWDEYIAPTIEGYTAIDSPVQLKKVDYDTKNTTVYITYTKNHTSGSGDDDKPTPPTPPDEPDNKKDDKTPTPPIQPTTPKEPDDKQSKPEPVPVKTHHKKSTTKQKKHLSTPKTAKNWSENNTPHGENRTFNNNVAPHSQSAPANNVAPNSEHIDAHGNVIGSTGQIIGFIDTNGKVHYVLPQTSDDQNNEKALMVIGGIAVAISMVGLAGVKKRKNN